MQQRLDVGRALQILLITVAELGRQDVAAHLGELEPAGVEPAAVQRQHRAFAGVVGIALLVIDPGTGFHQRLRAREIGLECLARERPAGMGHPVARFEFDCVHRTAPAAPVIGAAAQLAQPARIQRRIAGAGLGAGIHFLDGRIEIHAARFQQQHAYLAARQRQRQADAGRPAADNGKIGFQHRSGRNRAGVDQGGQEGRIRNKASEAMSVTPGLEKGLVLIVSENDGLRCPRNGRYYNRHPPRWPGR